MPLHIVPVVSVEEYVLMLLLFVDNFLLFLIQHFHPFLLCYPSEPVGNAVEIATLLMNKYKDSILKEKHNENN